MFNWLFRKETEEETKEETEERKQLLMQQIEAGNFKEAFIRLKETSYNNINQTHNNGETFLTAALKNINCPYEFIAALIYPKGANIHTTNASGKKPIEIFSQTYNQSVSQHTTPYINDVIPIFQILECDIPTMKNLVVAGKSYARFKLEKYHTPEEASQIEKIFKTNGIDLVGYDAERNSPLHRFVRDFRNFSHLSPSHYRKIIKTLAQLYNDQTNNNDEHALHIAVRNASMPLIYDLSAFPDNGILSRDKNGKIPLQYAIEAPNMQEAIVVLYNHNGYHWEYIHPEKAYSPVVSFFFADLNKRTQQMVNQLKADVLQAIKTHSSKIIYDKDYQVYPEKLSIDYLNMLAKIQPTTVYFITNQRPQPIKNAGKQREGRSS